MKINPGDKKWKGGLVPIGGLPETGGFKGFGLAVLVDFFCTLLSGAALDTKASHFFGAIKIDSFRPVIEFKQQMDQLIDSIENLPTLPGIKRVYTAGGVEEEIMEDRKQNGIPLDKQAVQSLKELLEEFDIKHDLGF